MIKFANNKILKIAGVFLVALFVLIPTAYAANLVVDFENDPLFGEVNFLPGDSETGDVTVTNNTDSTQSVYAESVNGYDPDGLGDQMRLRVLEDGSPVYDEVFGDFLSAGPVSLSPLNSSDATVYTFEVSFLDSADNDYMDKTLGFDLCIGFSGGNFQCGETVVSDTESPVTPSGGGGGGGGGQFVSLIIFNEDVSELIEGLLGIANGTAVIEWDTNMFSTSQVVYGLASGAPYTLDINNLPNLGYPLGTVEDGTKVTHHTVTLTGLIGGETYVYRVVSRASPATVSVEHTFTIPIDSNGVFVDQGGGATEGTTGGGTVGTSGGESLSQNEEESLVEDNNNLLALALSGFDFDFWSITCISWAIFIFLVLLLSVWLISRKRDDSLKKRMAYLVVLGLVASMILQSIPYTCSLIPLWTLIILYIIWKFVAQKQETLESKV